MWYSCIENSCSLFVRSRLLGFDVQDILKGPSQLLGIHLPAIGTYEMHLHVFNIIFVEAACSCVTMHQFIIQYRRKYEIKY